MFAKKSFVFPAVFFSVIISLFLTTHSALAAPIDNFPVTVTQPDGSLLNLFVSGDEFYNWLHDEQGYTIIQDPETGYYVYANLVKGVLVPTQFVVGKANPKLAGLRPYLNISPDQKAEIRETTLAQTEQMTGDIHNAPRVGTITNLVVFIRFSDESEFTEPFSAYTNMLNNSTPGANSLKNYYKEVSYNALTINSLLYPTPGSTIISYQDSHPRGYYRPYNSVTNPIGYTSDQRGTREQTLLRDAANYISGLGQFPSGATIDGDGDGIVDSLTFVVSGGPDGWNELLWPHAWVMFVHPLTISGKTVYQYQFQLQAMINNGILAHETFHVLGGPDLYHYTWNGIQPVGGWDVMEYDADPPQHMGCYMKYKYTGWISSLPELTSAGTYTLNPLTSATNNCMKIPSPYSTTEFFVMEYRNPAGSTFESSIPGTGLLVYRINSLYDGNAGGPPDEIYVYRPDGTLSQNGNVNAANFSTNVGRTAINDSTNPSSFLSNGTAGGLNLCNIGAAGSTISFDICYEALQYQLSVTKAGSGGGTVTSAPAGINCGSDCAELYIADTEVTLTAAEAVGSDFIGWSGACSGAGACVVTMDAAKSVTAYFAAECTSGLCVTVNDVNGYPIQYSEVEVYTSLDVYPLIRGTTDAFGYVQLDVAAGNYILVADGYAEHFLVKKNVTAPQTVVVDPTGTVPVTISARSLEDMPLDAAIRILPSPYAFTSLGNNDFNGELDAWVTPGTYTFLAWSWTDKYHLAMKDVNITTGGTINMHAADMPTGQVTVNTGDFMNSRFAVWFETASLGIGYSVPGTETFVLSTGQYDRMIDLGKWQGIDEWTYYTEMVSFQMNDGAHLTFNSGGDFDISTAVDGTTFRPGDQVSIQNRIEDSFGNRITGVQTYTDAASPSQGSVPLNTVSRDRDNHIQIQNAGQEPAAAAWSAVYPSITVKDASQNTISQDQNWQTWYSHNFALSGASQPGNYSVTLSLDTGPHMGVITAADTFDVLDSIHFVEASARDNWAHARGWPLDTQVALTIDGAAGTYSTTAAMQQAPWNPNDPNDIVAPFDLQGYDIQAGDQLTVTVDTQSKSLTVSPLEITAFDLENDTVSGKATPNVEIQVCANVSEGCISRTVTADGAGNWTVDYSPELDLGTGSTGWAAERDSEGDQTWYDWNAPDPHMDVWYADDSINAYDWPFGTHITLEIEDPATTLSPDYATGTDVDRYTDWNSHMTLGVFDLRGLFDIGPGMTVTISGGVITHQLIVSDLVITNIDQVADIITGTTEPNQMMWMWYSSTTPTCCRGFQADGDGNWSVDYSELGPYGEPKENIGPGSSGTINANDADGDNTSLNWNVPTPGISVRANENRVEGWEWTLGSTITVTVDDPLTLASPDITRTTVVYDVPWNPGEYRFDVNLNDAYDIKSDDVVTATDGVRLKTTTVTSLAFTDMNMDTDVVTGVAAAGSTVDIWTCDNINCYNVDPSLVADENGDWSVDFTPIYNLTYGSWVDSSQTDADGDSTMFGWNFPNPSVQVRPNDNTIEGQEWTLGDTITITVDDPGTTSSPDVTTTAVVYQPEWNANERRFDVSLNGTYDIKTGDVVTATDGTVLKTTTVTSLAFTEVDIDTDVVTGVAQAGSSVDIWTCDYANCYNYDPDPVADENGDWSVDFTSLYNIVNGTWIDSGQIGARW